MGYLGTPIDTNNTFQSLQGKRFNGDGSTTNFTLDVAPTSTLDIEVFVENVRQDPNSAYTLSGTTLAFAAAPGAGTNNIYVIHQAKAVGTISAGAGTVNADSMDNTVISGHDALAATPAGTDELLISDAGTIKRIDASFFQNTPMFSVYRSTAQSLSNATTTKIQFNNTLYDTDSTWDGTNYRFVAPSSGYYSFQSSLGFQGTITRVILFFYKNASEYQRAVDLNITGATIVNGSCEMYLDADGYCEVFGYVAGSSNDVRNQAETWFSGSKLIGV